MKTPPLAPLLVGLLGLSARYPPWLFGLRLAAQLSSAMLFVFGSFLILLHVSGPVLLYALLMLAFGVLNLTALYRIKTAPTQSTRLSYAAHICSALLPLTYIIGVLISDTANGFVWHSVLAVTTPAALNSLAIEQSLRFQRRQQHHKIA